LQAEPAEDSLQFHEKLSSYIKNRLQQKAAKITEVDWGVYDIANQAFDAMQSTIARQKLAAYPPDHIIEIARNACGTLEFDRADEMIALGYRKAQESFS
jgi:NTE family protein